MVSAGAASAALAGGGPGPTGWQEIGDAGQLVPTAQLTDASLGNGPLDQITGNVQGGTADMYCINIVDPTNFLAETRNQFTNFDTQLFLFTMSGTPIAMNDDDPLGNSTRSRLSGGAAPLAGLVAGHYLLAISGYDLDPHDGIRFLFPDQPFDRVHGPVPGAGDLVGWSPQPAGGSVGGRYQIMLEGCDYCIVPAPSGAALLAFAGVVASRRRRS